MKPPPRLLDDPSVAPELRADLKRAATSLPAYNAAAGLASFQAAIGSSLGAPTAAATHAAQAKTATAVTVGKSATVLGSAGAKVALLALGSAALVTVGTLSFPSHVAAPQHHPASHAAAPFPAAPIPTAPAQPAPTSLPEPTTLPPAPQAPALPAPTAEAPVAVRDAGHARARERTYAPTMHGATRQADPDDALRLEVAQLGQIKSVLDSDPAQAYRLAEAGHKTFSRGMLRPEREALATLALWNLGRRDEATRRAEAFLTRYPTSPLRARLQLLVERR